MKYCPKCKMEYEDYVLYCSDCHGLLTAPPIREEWQDDGEEVVPVYLTNASAWDAPALIAFLQEHRVPVLSKAPGSGGFLGVVMGASFYGDDLYVNERDWEKARRLLEEYQQARQQERFQQSNDSKDSQQDPFLKRRNIFRIILWVALGLMGLQLLIGLILPLFT